MQQKPSEYETIIFRSSMLSSLTDGSTETFWESGDEDRNKTKSVTIKCPNQECIELNYLRFLEFQIKGMFTIC